MNVERTAPLRAALVRNFHDVRVSTSPSPRPPRGTDAWFHGLHWTHLVPMTADTRAALLDFAGPIALFQADDDVRLWMSKVPGEVAARTHRFLRNHWARDRVSMPAETHDRIGFLPPMIVPLPAVPGPPLSRRRRAAVFYGSWTGPETGGEKCRDRLVRLMRRSGLPFEGGLIANDVRECVGAPTELLVAPVSRRRHAALLSETRICLAPWGNCPLTYRLYEGLARRALVIAPSIQAIEFLDCGLRAGEHYVEVAPDLGDLLEKVAHYLDALDEAQAIADAGHEHFRRWFAFSGRNLPQHFLDQAAATWGGMLRPVEAPSLRARVRAFRRG